MENKNVNKDDFDDIDFSFFDEKLNVEKEKSKRSKQTSDDEFDYDIEHYGTEDYEDYFLHMDKESIKKLLALDRKMMEIQKEEIELLKKCIKKAARSAERYYEVLRAIDKVVLKK